MSQRTADFETRLRQALAPIDPPDELEERLENRLQSLAIEAADQLEGWELGAMRDPRNWMPTVTAAAVGGAAAVGLAVVRTQRKRHRRRAASGNVIELAEHTVRDFAREAGKIIDEAQRRL